MAELEDQIRLNRRYGKMTLIDLMRRLEQFEDLVCESAPLAWARPEMYDAAHRWEIKAYALLRSAPA